MLSHSKTIAFSAQGIRGTGRVIRSLERSWTCPPDIRLANPFMRMHYYCHNLKTQNYNNAVPYILGFAVKKTKNNYKLSFIDKKNKNLFIPDYFLLFLCIKK